MANMVGAFFGTASDSSSLFEERQVTKDKEGNDNPDYYKHLNKHNVIFIDFSEIPRDCKNYGQYIDRIQNGMNKDFVQAYPDLDIHMADAVWDVLTKVFQETGDKFIFVMDEWDALFHMAFMTEETGREYLLFLKALLKGKVYVELAYMTGK